MPNYRVFCIYGYSQFRLFVFPSPGPRPQFVFTGPGIQFIVLQLKCVIALQHLLTCTSYILLIWVRELSVYTARLKKQQNCLCLNFIPILCYDYYLSLCYIFFSCNWLMNGLVWDIELLCSFQGSSSKKIDTTSFLKLCNNLEKFWFTASKALVDILYEEHSIRFPHDFPNNLGLDLCRLKTEILVQPSTMSIFETTCSRLIMICLYHRM